MWPSKTHGQDLGWASHQESALFYLTFPSFSERDAFDTLFDHAPDKLNVVKKVGKKSLGWGGGGAREESER